MDRVEFTVEECWRMLLDLEYGIDLAIYHEDPATQFRLEAMFDLIADRLGLT